MEAIFAFAAGAALGAVGYHRFYAEKFRGQEICCNEKDKDRELYRQLERLISYSGKER